MFERWSTSLPSACSGDRYSATPNTVSDTGTGATKLITFTASFADNEHVLGRQIVVDDAHLLALEQRLADLRDDRLGAIQRQRAVGRHQLLERLPLAELTGDEQATARVLAEVDHARELAALRALQLLQLALRALQRRRRRQRSLRDQLVSDDLAGLRVARPPNLAASRTADLRSPSGSARRRRRNDRVQTPRPLRRGAPLLRAEVSVVGILRLTVRAEFHPVGRIEGPGRQHRDRRSAMLPHICARKAITPRVSRRVSPSCGGTEIRNYFVLASRRPQPCPQGAPCPRTARPRWASTSCSPWPCAFCPR